MNAPVLADKLHLQGALTTYVKRGASGDTVRTTFCPTCGTPLHSSKDDAPQFVWLRLGWVAQRAQLPSMRQGFCHAAMPRATDISDVPKLGASGSRTA